MKQSKYPPAELRDGPDFLSIEDFDYGWADTNIVTIMLKVSSGTFQAYATCDCATRQLCDFVDQLQKMYEFKCFNAELSAMYYGSSVTLSMRRTGHIQVEGKIFSDGMDQCLTFTFGTDLSALQPFISGLKRMIS